MIIQVITTNTTIRFKEFEKQLHEKIQYIFESLNPSDNPVSDFLGHTNEYLRFTFEREREEIGFLLELFRDQVKHNYGICETILEVAKTGQLPENGTLMVFDFFPFDLLLARMVNTRWQVMPMQMIRSFNDVLQNFRQMFLPIHQGWQILRINPTSEVNESFFSVVEAVWATNKGDLYQLLEGLIEEARGMDMTVSYTPKGSANRYNVGQTDSSLPKKEL